MEGAQSAIKKSESSSKLHDEIRRAMHRHQGGVDSTGRQRQATGEGIAQVASININIFLKRRLGTAGAQ